MSINKNIKCINEFFAIKRKIKKKCKKYAYLSACAKSQQIVPFGFNIVYEVVNSCRNMSFVKGSSLITINISGVYYVTINIVTSEPSNDCKFSLFLNGIECKSFMINTGMGSLTLTHILTLRKFDTIFAQNKSQTNTVIDASLNIFKLQ